MLSDGDQNTPDQSTPPSTSDGYCSSSERTCAPRLERPTAYVRSGALPKYFRRNACAATVSVAKSTFQLPMSGRGVCVSAPKRNPNLSASNDSRSKGIGKNVEGDGVAATVSTIALNCTALLLDAYA